MKTVTKGEGDFEVELNKLQLEILKSFDKRELDARKKGNKEIVDRIKTLREKIEVEGILPKTLTPSLTRRLDTARDTLNACYRDAVKELLVINDDETAGQVDKKRAALELERPSQDVFYRVMLIRTQNLVLNGSFEKPIIKESYDINKGGTNWFDSPQSKDRGAIMGGSAAEGCQVLQIHGDIVNQDIQGLEVNSQYILSYFVSGMSAGEYQGPNTVTARIGTNSNTVDVDAKGLVGTERAPWEKRVITFTATDNTMVLEFSAPGGQQCLPCVDAISIIKIPKL